MEYGSTVLTTCCWWPLRNIPNTAPARGDTGAGDEKPPGSLMYPVRIRRRSLSPRRQGFVTICGLTTPIRISNAILPEKQCRAVHNDHSVVQWKFQGRSERKIAQLVSTTFFFPVLVVIVLEGLLALFCFVPAQLRALSPQQCSSTKLKTFYSILLQWIHTEPPHLLIHLRTLIGYSTAWTYIHTIMCPWSA